MNSSRWCPWSRSSATKSPAGRASAAPWFTDWDDGVIHATEEDAQAAADLAQRTTGYPWELLPVYDEEPDPGPVIPPQDV